MLAGEEEEEEEEEGEGGGKIQRNEEDEETGKQEKQRGQFFTPVDKWLHGMTDLVHVDTRPASPKEQNKKRCGETAAVVGQQTRPLVLRQERGHLR